MDLDHPFRNAVFGGFNRQDVLTYLENTSRQTAQQRQELEQRLEALQSTVSQQDAQLAEQQEQLGRLTQENSDLKAQVEQLSAHLESARAQHSQSAADLAQTEQQAKAAGQILLLYDSQYPVEYAYVGASARESRVLALRTGVSGDPVPSAWLDAMTYNLSLLEELSGAKGGDGA